MFLTLAIIATLATGAPPTEHVSACGPAALYICARQAGLTATRSEIERLCQPASDGTTSLPDLAFAAKQIGFRGAVPVKTSVEELSRYRNLAVIYDNNASGCSSAHFVALVGQTKDGFLCVNPTDGEFLVQVVPKSAALAGWEGYALLLLASPDSSPFLLPTGATVTGVILGLLWRMNRHRNEGARLRELDSAQESA